MVFTPRHEKLVVVTSQFGFGGAGVGVKSLIDSFLNLQPELNITIISSSLPPSKCSYSYHQFRISKLRKLLLVYGSSPLFKPAKFLRLFSTHLPSFSLTFRILVLRPTVLLICHTGDAYLPFVPLLRLFGIQRIVHRPSDFHQFFGGCHYPAAETCNLNCYCCNQITNPFYRIIPFFGFLLSRLSLRSYSTIFYRTLHMYELLKSHAPIISSSLSFTLPVYNALQPLSPVPAASLSYSITFVSHDLSDPRKGLASVLHIFQSLRAHYNFASLSLLGGNPPPIIHTIDGVQYDGFLSREHVVQHLQSSTFYASYSNITQDNMPNTLVEALMAGSIIITDHIPEELEKHFPPLTFIYLSVNLSAPPSDFVHVLSLSAHQLHQHKVRISEAAFRVFSVQAPLLSLNALLT